MQKLIFICEGILSRFKYFLKTNDLEKGCVLWEDYKRRQKSDRKLRKYSSKESKQIILAIKDENKRLYSLL